jgi:hypothetical protein
MGLQADYHIERFRYPEPISLPRLWKFQLRRDWSGGWHSAAGAAARCGRRANRSRNLAARLGHTHIAFGPYGDDPQDQAMIMLGISYAQNGCRQ